jgi:hypothetical protein
MTIRSVYYSSLLKISLHDWKESLSIGTIVTIERLGGYNERFEAPFYG